MVCIKFQNLVRHRFCSWRCDGWFALHEKNGKRPCLRFTPSIKYAREGSCSEVIAYYWQMNQERIGHYDGFVRLLSTESSAKGDVFKNPVSRDL